MPIFRVTNTHSWTIFVEADDDDEARKFADGCEADVSPQVRHRDELPWVVEIAEDEADLSIFRPVTENTSIEARYIAWLADKRGWTYEEAREYAMSQPRCGLIKGVEDADDDEFAEMMEEAA